MMGKIFVDASLLINRDMFSGIAHKHYILTMWTLSLIYVTISSTDPFDLYKIDSTCPEVSKYLKGSALGIVVS